MMQSIFHILTVLRIKYIELVDQSDLWGKCNIQYLKNLQALNDNCNNDHSDNLVEIFNEKITYNT